MNQWDKKRGIWQPKITEEMVVREITERLWYQAKIKVWRIAERIPGMSKRLSTPGIPDLIGWIKESPFCGCGTYSIPLFIECKKPGGVRRPAQEAFITEAQVGGCCAFFAESWDDVVRELETYGIKLKGD